MNPRVPRKTKELRGTMRKDRNPKKEPKAPKLKRVPPPPGRLSGVAADEWRRLAPLLDEAGLLSPFDLVTFELLCAAYGDYCEAREAIYTDDKGNRRTLREYLTGRNSQTMPEYAAMKSAFALYKSYMSEFGLSPVSRNRIDIAPPDKGEKDPMEELLDG